MKTIKSLSFKSGKKLAFSSPFSRSFGTTLPVYFTFLSSKKTIHRSFHGYFHSSSPASFLLSQSVNPTNNRYLQKYYSGKNLTTLSHLSEDGRHTNMVDITSKSESYREAHAQAKISLPSFIIDKIRENNTKDHVLHVRKGSSSSIELQTKKGPVFNTAIVAGIMAVKKTSELIPMCHPLAIEKCNIYINLSSEMNENTNGEGEKSMKRQDAKETLANDADDDMVIIDCIVGVSGKTGVEMEALTGCSIAALTIYDMCKALSHDIVIHSCHLIRKTGGKSDLNRNVELKDKKQPLINIDKYTVDYTI